MHINSNLILNLKELGNRVFMEWLMAFCGMWFGGTFLSMFDTLVGKKHPKWKILKYKTNKKRHAEYPVKLGTTYYTKFTICIWVAVAQFMSAIIFLIRNYVAGTAVLSDLRIRGCLIWMLLFVVLAFYFDKKDRKYTVIYEDAAMIVHTIQDYVREKMVGRVEPEDERELGNNMAQMIWAIYDRGWSNKEVRYECLNYLRTCFLTSEEPKELYTLILLLKLFMGEEGYREENIESCFTERGRPYAWFLFEIIHDELNQLQQHS